MVQVHLASLNTLGSVDTALITIAISQRVRVLRLLASSELGRLFLRAAGDNDDDDSNTFGIRRRRRRQRLDPDRFPKVPSDKGAELMDSGYFGFNEIQSTDRITQRKRLARRILDRELGVDSHPRQKANRQLMAQVSLWSWQEESSH